MTGSRLLVAEAMRIVDAALARVQADGLLQGSPWQSWMARPADDYARVLVLGMGKAAMAMAGVVEQTLVGAVDGGLVVVPHGHPAGFPERLPPPRRVEVVEAAHPVPDASSERAAHRLLAEAAAAGRDDLVLVLVSGGGTALTAAPVDGVSLAEAQETFRLLLRAGADIHAMNTVRKHITRVGGGRLGAACAPAEVLALVVSDVIGDDLSVIASGPTVPDPTTVEHACGTLCDYDLWARVPPGVRRVLGETANAAETPKPQDARFERIRTELIGSNGRALAAAAAAARACGFHTRVVDDQLSGEARSVAGRIAQEMEAAAGGEPVCLLWGGETAVTVTGGGRGGRNQELALTVGLALEDEPWPYAFASVGTDGRDGPTDAAGAWVRTGSMAQARAEGAAPEGLLADNDAYAFFDRWGGLVRTGPTHTNVMDVQVALLGAPSGLPH